MADDKTTVPLWQGQPITAGWWWLQFPDGPGPRHWDGMFWDRGSYFAPAEDYADNAVLGPCVAPTPKPDTEERALAEGWDKSGIGYGEGTATMTELPPDTCAVCQTKPAQFVFHFRHLGGDVPLCSDACADQLVESVLKETPG